MSLPRRVAYDDEHRPVPVVMPEVYEESPFAPAQLMAARIVLGCERDRTLTACAQEAGCTVQNLSAMVKDYSRCLKAGFGMREKKFKKNLLLG